MAGSKASEGKSRQFFDTSVKNKNGVSYIYTVRGSNPAHLGPYNANGRRISRLGTPGLTGVYNSKEELLSNGIRLKAQMVTISIENRIQKIGQKLEV